MNKKTFSLAGLFLGVTLAWLGLNIYWAWHRQNCVLDLLIALVFVVAAAAMVYNEFKKKRRKHLDEINKHKIP
ncbi:MAG: hypothetical protein RR410_08660 [Alistipes sp.]